MLEMLATSAGCGAAGGCALARLRWQPTALRGVRRAALRILIAAQAARARADHQQQAGRHRRGLQAGKVVHQPLAQPLIPALGRQRVQRLFKPQPRARHQVRRRLHHRDARRPASSAPAPAPAPSGNPAQPVMCRSSSCACSSGSSPYAAVTIRSCASSQFIATSFQPQRISLQLSAISPHLRLTRALPMATDSYRNSANCVLNFLVALKSVFLAVSSVVFNISPMVRRRRPW